MIMPVRLSPVTGLAEKAGAQFAERRGWREVVNYSTVEVEAAVAMNGAALADESANGKLLVEGVEAALVLQLACGGEPPPLGFGSPLEGGWAYRLRPDLFFLSLPPSEERPMLAKLEAAAMRSGHFVTTTDITDGRFEFRLIGPEARELLGKLCALDLHPASFPNHCARQTLVAKVTALVFRRDVGDLPAFSLIGARSLGAYFWEVFVHGGRRAVE